MSICSDIYIERKEALERVYKFLMSQQEDLIRKAVNSMDNNELASQLHSEMYYYHVTGKGKLEKKYDK